jgi:putative transposase
VTTAETNLGVAPAARAGGLAAWAEASGQPLRELMDDRLLDALLERSLDQAGGLRLTGEGSMLGELVRTVLERTLESELTAHLGYEKGGRGGAGGNAAGRC